ncbi:hypothetical protein [Photobacterium leiognathi]|uniref:hypothetical protein n=1 Tax=Photobacterium leiognathi TaxID=553611 RepID=UPI0011B20165|nr:hypothetical protein [Photobacterium leiognathi]
MSSPNGCVYFGFALSQIPDACCLLQNTYSSNGILAFVFNATAEIKYKSKTSKIIVKEGIIDCISATSCNDNDLIALFHGDFTGYPCSGGMGCSNDNYFLQANLSSIRVLASKNVKPGVYIIPVGISNIDVGKCV